MVPPASLPVNDTDGVRQVGKICFHDSVLHTCLVSSALVAPGFNEADRTDNLSCFI